ncbi:hypothetical protein DFH09DRAFT_1317743 [Mycena vulgaris]|nr:hypothetical protein DFH09DRAFT_1317743 [Mycena vulgaris]
MKEEEMKGRGSDSSELFRATATDFPGPISGATLLVILVLSLLNFAGSARFVLQLKNYANWYPSGPHDRLFRGVFAHCALLEVVIFCCHGDDDLRANIGYFDYLADEPRSVLLAVDFLKDWAIGAEGGADY